MNGGPDGDVSNFDWNDERIAELRRLWDESNSGGKIAAQFGVTRNTVMGKLRRLGLLTVRTPKQPVVRFAPAPPAPPFPAPPPLSVSEPGPGGVPTEFLRSRQCKFVLTDSAPWLHCAAETPSSGDPWCPKCRAKVYQLQPKRRESGIARTG